MMNRASMDKLVNDHFMYEATADLEGVIGTYTHDPNPFTSACSAI